MLNRIYQIKKTLKNRLRKSPDPFDCVRFELAVTDGGLFCRLRIIGQAHQIIQGDAVDLAQGDGRLDLRIGFPMLPGEDGLLRDAQAVSEFDLGKAEFFPELFQSVAWHRSLSFLYLIK